MQTLQAGYAGLVCAPLGDTAQTMVYPVSQDDRITRPALPENREGWNRIGVKVTPAGVAFFMNGHMIYKDADYSRTSPWLHLFVKQERVSTIRNLRLTGNLAVPREVTLIEADRLDGWMCRYFNERVPSRLAPKEPKPPATARLGGAASSAALPAAVSGVAGAPASPPRNDWQAADGVLSGRSDPALNPGTQSWLYYHRPLQSGDVLRYQFHYEPGKKHVHPAIGRLAALLTPAGVRWHWMHKGNEPDEPLGFDTRNVADDPASRRGPSELPLKENEWNDMEVSLAGDVFALRLNGVLICERRLGSDE